MENFLPKVSVIIPVYNAEKYLGACLESLAIQTFTDFEVIVVDDCSTDSSATIAEKFFERFGGRLKIISLPKNTGSGAVPRNIGLKFSRGEYIFFMDDDDLIVDIALETLYNFAEKFQADVVYTERGFLLDVENFTETAFDKNISAVGVPTLESDNFSERVEKFLRTGYSWAPWTKLLRRDFLITNSINFPAIKISEDVLWTLQVICLAKKILRVPNRLYIYRSLKNSWSRTERTPADEIKFWLDPLAKGVDFLDEFLSKLEFFAKNPRRRFDVTNFFVKMQLAGMLGALDKINRYELYEIFYREFSKNGDRHAALIASLLVFMNFYRSKS